MKGFRQCPFLIIIIISMLSATIYGCGIKIFSTDETADTVEVAAAIHSMKSAANSLIGRDELETLFPETAGGEIAPPPVSGEWVVEHDFDNEGKEKKKETKKEGNEEVSISGAESGNSETETAASGEDSIYEVVEEYDGSEDVVSENDPDKSASFGNGTFKTVDKSYFTQGDTLLIGDSRMLGFGLWSGLENVSVYAEKGYALYSVFEKAIIDSPAGKLTLPQAMELEKGKYTKIYLKFGLNEMGYGTYENFNAYYYQLIDMLKYYQDRATIYVCSVLPVTANKAAKSPVYGNDNIKKRNENLRMVARNEHVCYLDLFGAYVDENGVLPADYASDGIHIKSKYMGTWVEFLQTHAIVNRNTVSENSGTAVTESQDKEARIAVLDISPGEEADETDEEGQESGTSGGMIAGVLLDGIVMPDGSVINGTVLPVSTLISNAVMPDGTVVASATVDGLAVESAVMEDGSTVDDGYLPEGTRIKKAELTDGTVIKALTDKKIKSLLNENPGASLPVAEVTEGAKFYNITLRDGMKADEAVFKGIRVKNITLADGTKLDTGTMLIGTRITAALLPDGRMVNGGYIAGAVVNAAKVKKNN